jgi:hypothetical protein
MCNKFVMIIFQYFFGHFSATFIYRKYIGMLPINNSQKVAAKFCCEICNYNTSKKSDYAKHLSTDKHKILQNPTFSKMSNFAPKKYECTCGKQYSHSSTLYAHKKKCVSKGQKNDFIKNKEDVETLVQYLMKENIEFKQLIIDQNKQMIELAKNSGHNITNNTNNTNNMNTNNFNLNFFLNEKCKNALNIMDFVNQLQVEVKDLEETGRLGFSEGISKIFINGLKQIDISDRPVHCSDFKRETLYIKNNDKWNKETDDKVILTNAIKHIAHKNMRQISEWTKSHPEYNDSDSKQNDKYLRIVSESMSGASLEETNKNYNKIIKNIIKETVIDKCI